MDSRHPAMVCSHRDIALDIGLRAHTCEETAMPFYEKGDAASATRRPGPASRCYSSPAVV